MAALIWGAYLAVSRQGIAHGLDPLDLSFLRYATAGLILLPWLLRNGPMSLAGVGWVRGSTLALLAGPPFVLVGSAGFLFAPLAHGAVIQLGSLTLAGAVLARTVGREAIDAGRAFALGIVCLGLVVTAGPAIFQGNGDAWIGDILFATAGGMWAVFTVLQRRWSLDPLSATAAVSVLSALVIIPLYLAAKGLEALAVAPLFLLVEQVLVLGLLTGVAALLAFVQSVADLGAGRAAIFPALAPAVAIILGIPLTQEWPNLYQGLGLALLSVGLLLASKQPARRGNHDPR